MHGTLPAYSIRMGVLRLAEQKKEWVLFNQEFRSFPNRRFDTKSTIFNLRSRKFKKADKDIEECKVVNPW